MCHGWRQHRNLDDLGVHSIAQYTDDPFTKADFFFFFFLLLFVNEKHASV